MAKSDGSSENDGEMLPDEREAVAERLDSLEEDERLSIAEVAEELEIEIDE